jgi:hypothetical protein
VTFGQAFPVGAHECDPQSSFFGVKRPEQHNYCSNLACMRGGPVVQRLLFRRSRRCREIHAAVRSHLCLNHSRTWRSRSVSVRRQMPPLGVAPNFAVSISVSQRRWASFCRFCMGNSLQCGTCDSIFGVLRAVRQNLLMDIGACRRNHQSPVGSGLSTLAHGGLKPDIRTSGQGQNRRSQQGLRRRQCETFIDPASHAADHHFYRQAEPRKA